MSYFLISQLMLYSSQRVTLKIRMFGLITSKQTDLDCLFQTTNKKLRELNGTWTHGPQYDFTPQELQGRMQLAGLREVELHGVGALTSWIRLFPRNKQDPFYRSPTPFKLLNETLWSLDANTNLPLNRKFGREILGIGKKP